MLEIKIIIIIVIRVRGSWVSTLDLREAIIDQRGCYSEIEGVELGPLNSS